jgi:hypothetical protein
LYEWDVPVTSMAGGLETMPPDGHVLLLFAPRESFSDTNVGRVLSWVEKGGLLIVSPSEGAADPLLDRLGVSRKEVRRAPSPQTTPAHEDPRPEAVKLKLVVHGEEIHAETVSDLRFAHGHRDADIATPELDAAFLLSFPYGDGRVTLVADPGMFTNLRIGKAGHARLLLRLVSAPADPEADEEAPSREAWLYRRDGMPSFFTLLNRRAGPAVWSGLVLLAAILLYAGRRFGPIRSETPPGRRSLLEHIDAAGEYLLKKGRGEVLLEAPRAAVWRRLALVEPATAAAGRRDSVRRLSTLSHLPPGRVERVLFGELPQRPEQLAETIRTLEILRRCL